MKNKKSTANATNRVSSFFVLRAKKVQLLVSEYERDRARGKIKQRNWKFRHRMGDMKISKCSQCKRGMRKDWADIQIENKRENAPICIPCIMGWKRKPLQKYN